MFNLSYVTFSYRKEKPVAVQKCFTTFMCTTGIQVGTIKYICIKVYHHNTIIVHQFHIFGLLYLCVTKEIVEPYFMYVCDCICYTHSYLLWNIKEIQVTLNFSKT